MKNIFLTVCFLFLLFSFTFSEAGEKDHLLSHISGQVIDSTDKTPLEFALVTIKGTKVSTLTNDEGLFNIEIPRDTFTLLATYVGYKLKELKLNSKLASQNLVISLTKESTEIDEVRVITEKEKIARMSPDVISAIKISPKLITKLPNMGEVDVMRSFQLLPGISGSNESHRVCM